MEVSDVSGGTSYQSASTYLFVPNKLGTNSNDTTDDTNTPGAYFRLGGYSADLEGQATGDLLKEYYPRNHLTAEGDNAITNAQGSASGDAGIMFACSGRLLIRNAEKTYLHSTGAIDIDTEDDLTINADGDIDVTSNGKIHMSTSTDEIKIVAADGNANLTTKGYTVTHEALGEEWKSTTSNSYSYYNCDVYTWKQGSTWDFVAAKKFSFYSGIGLSITASLDLTIGLSISLALAFIKVEYSLLKIEYTNTKIGSTINEVKIAGATNFTSATVKIGAELTKIANSGINTAIKGIETTSKNIQAEAKTLKTEITNLASIIAFIVFG